MSRSRAGGEQEEREKNTSHEMYIYTVFRIHAQFPEVLSE